MKSHVVLSSALILGIALSASAQVLFNHLGAVPPSSTAGTSSGSAGRPGRPTGTSG